MSKQINKTIGVAYVERKAHSLLTYVRPTSLEPGDTKSNE